MSKNIYDLFNERKYGIDMLVEGSEEFDTVEEGIEALEMITQECANNVIELQAANYLEDLVLENMMYNHFDEEEMSTIIEGTIGERLSNWGKTIKSAWGRLKEWFKSMIKTIGAFFRANEEFVRKHNKDIAEAMKQCNAQVKMNDYKPFKEGMNAVRGMVDKLKSVAQNPNMSKDAITKCVGGAKDRSMIPEVVKRCFVKSEGKKWYVDQISATIAIAYAGGGKDLLDFLKKEQAAVDKQFSEILKHIEGGGDDEKNVKRYENFMHAMGLQNTIYNNAIVVVKKACSDMLVVCRKAVGKISNAVGDAKVMAGGYADAIKSKFTKESYEWDEDDVLEEGLFNKFRKLSDEELSEKIDQLQAAVDDIDNGDGPKKFKKKAHNELKAAKSEQARRGKKSEKAEAKAAKKAERAAKKAAKRGGGELPAVEAFIADLDDIEFDDDWY